MLTAIGSIGLALSLAGCAADSNPPSSSKLQASPSPTATEQHTGDFTIPNNFPNDIPIRSGEVVLASVAGDEPNLTWAIEVIVDDLDVARSETLADLTAAGFTLQEETGTGTSNYQATMAREDFLVRLKIYFEEDTGELEVRYVVTPNNV